MRSSSMKVRLAATAALGLATVLSAACEGDNLFRSGVGQDPTADNRAPEVELQQPRNGAAQPVGDSIFVSVLLSDNRGIERVEVRGEALRGDPDLGTDTIVERFEPRTVTFLEQPDDTLLTRFLQPTEGDITREEVRIIVEAFDAAGNSFADTALVVLGGPRVQILNLVEGQEIKQGLNLGVRYELADPDGVVSSRIDVTGAFRDSVVTTFSPAIDETTVDTVVTIPANVTGPIQIQVTARNSQDAGGSDGPFNLEVVSGGPGDTLRPSAKVEAVANDRLEKTDSIFLTLTAADNSQGTGVARMGYTVRAVSAERGSTLVDSDEVTFSPARTGNVERPFAFTPFNVDSLNLPDTLIFEVTVWAIDGAGNCGASVVADSLVSLPCTNLPSGEIVADGRTGSRVVRPIVAGRTIRLPAGGLIMDAVVDRSRRALLLSNLERDQVEVFKLDDELFLNPLPVGSEPWGLDFSRNGDTLIVANSGSGANFSNVYLGDADLSGAGEARGRRFFVPDVILYDVEESENDAGDLVWTITPIPDQVPPGFSDRPQYVAVDAQGSLVYSTKVVPTLGDFGTIRRSELPAGGQFPETRVFWEHAGFLDADDFYAIANIDSITVDLVPVFNPRDSLTESGDTVEVVDTLFVEEVTIFDHVPGFPNDVFSGSGRGPAEAFAILENEGTDGTFEVGARWDVPGIGFADTTYVSRSGDRNWVVFGEGAVSPEGRLIMYDVSNDRLSDPLSVADILTNAGETVSGVGLNYDGTLGVARGENAYFFSTGLRLQGVADLGSGGTGAALHPLHADYPSLSNPSGSYNPNTHMAFLGSGDRSIDIVNAFHFQGAARELSRIAIRDVVVGPLRAALPFPEDNASYQCRLVDVSDQNGAVIGQTVEIFADAAGENPHPATGGPTEDACVVVKLYGITSSGGVVVIDVRKGDVLRGHPTRL